MPERTYSGIDLEYYDTIFTAGFGPNPATPGTPSQGVLSLFISVNWPGGSDSIYSASYLQAFGYFNYSAEPDPIPAGSLISEIDFSWSIHAALAASSNNGPGPGNQSIAECRAKFNAIIGSESMVNNNVDEQDSNSGFGAVNASVNIDDDFSIHTIITFDPPISKIDFQDGYSQLALHVGMDEPGLNAFADGIDTVSASITGAMNLDNFTLKVTYEEGPTQFTVQPPGGDQPPGQILTVTGPGAAEQDYFFETEDGIIPVKPKIVGPDEVIIELPYPATDPCLDCFPECPSCDAAFAPCDADFTSEACQEAMQECLDCLAACLEDLSLAEECQESSHNPPSTPPIVTLVVGTQFSGNVPLGQFTILNADGSGLYRFVIGQRHDTLYAPDRDGTTYDVKIPNPGAKTGFFRS